jgi:hypothetical protein
MPIVKTEIMSESLDRIASLQLSANERLLWSGKPRPGIRFSPRDLFPILVGIAWCGLIGSWEWRVVSDQAPLMVQLYGVPFIAIGLHLLAGRFLMEALQRKETFYAVTTERIIIETNFIFRATKFLSLRTLGEITISERSDRSGSILLGPVGYASGGDGAVLHYPPKIDSIEEVREVYRLILAAQKKVLSKIGGDLAETAP